jgi:hypothetical protein
MKFKLSIFIAINLFLSLTAASAVTILPGLTLLIWGTIELKSEAWSQFQATSAPRVLSATDQVRPAPDKSATILCADLSSKNVPTGGPYQIKSLCPTTSEQPLTGGDGSYVPPRGGNNSLIPYIISPRKTQILTPRPLIRWNAVPGARRYTVQLLDSTGTIWTKEVQGTEVRYPGNPALQTGVSYALIVKGDTGTSSSDEGIPGLAFRLLDADAAKRLETAVQGLQQPDLPDEAKVFAEVYLYQSNQLFAEAIERLEPTTNSVQANASSHRLQGDLYLQVRLNQLAKDAYLRAITLAQREGDLETLAAAQVSLGGVYLVFRDREAAVKEWLTARQVYVQLEGRDSERVRAIEAQISALALQAD